MNQDYYELRYIETSTVDSGAFSLFDDSADRRTLLDFSKQNDKVFLLGNPGIGKTTELKNVFESIWEDIDEEQLVPIIIDIKNFRLISKLEDLISVENWQEHPSVIFIFDGLDEIANIQDFISELENFIEKYSHLKLKYLISCRTNIYEKYLIEIKNFETVYLKYLSIDQIKSILEKKYELVISDKEIENLESVLQTPFNLNLFANYHIENGNFPKTVEESMELFTNSEARRTREKLSKRFSISESQILSACNKVAFTAELLQRNSISEPELYKILGDEGITIFQELPFIEIQESKKDFNFRHKNYQEYFAANYISQMENDDIIRLITADGLDKIKPALFNTVTFLLNILKGDKFEAFREWLFVNDIEVLFFADENRLTPEIRKQVFEAYYKDQCVNRTFWLKNNGKIKTDVLADYADFKFLINEIKNDDRLERSRISLIELLPYKSLTAGEEEEVKKMYLELIKGDETDFYKSEILRAIKISEFYKKDAVFWNEILFEVQGSKDNAVTHQLISIISDLPDDQRDNEQLLLIISSHFQSKSDRVLRGTEQVIGNLILTTNNSNLFLSLVKFLFDENNSLGIDSIYSLEFKEKLANRIENFAEEKKFKIAFLEYCFSDDVRLFFGNDYLSLVVSRIGISADEMLLLLRLQNTQKHALYSLSRYFTSHSINAVVDAYSKGTLEFVDDKNIESIRNWMSNSERNLSLIWQEEFLTVGYKFSQLLATDEEIRKLAEDFEMFKKRNLEIIFCKDELKQEISSFFQENNITEIDRPQYNKLHISWYEQTGYHGLLNSIHVILEHSLRRQKVVSSTFVNQLLNEEHFILNVVKSVLSHNSANSYNLQDNERTYIEKLAHQLEEKIDYNNILLLHPTETDRFSTTINYEYVKVLLFFDQRFDIIQRENFYLNIIEYGNITGGSQNEHGNFVEFVKQRILNEAKLNEVVITNINDKILLYPAKKDHFEYAINNNLHESFQKIGDELTKHDYLFFDSILLESLLEKINNPVEYLKACCTNVTTQLCWRSSKLLKEKYGENEFCLQIAREYFKTEHTDFLDKAVNILFYLNQPDALCYYEKLLEKMIGLASSSGYLPTDISNYTQISEILVIESLFYKIFAETSEGSFYLHKSREFLRILISNLGKNKEGYKFTLSVLQKIRSNVKGKEAQTFYINNLIEILEKSYIQQNSKEISIDEIVRIIS